MIQLRRGRTGSCVCPNRGQGQHARSNPNEQRYAALQGPRRFTHVFSCSLEHAGRLTHVDRMNDQKRTTPIAAEPATRLNVAPPIPHILMKTSAVMSPMGAAMAFASNSKCGF